MRYRLFPHKNVKKSSGVRNFYLKGQIAALIYLSRQPLHIYMDTLFITYTHFFIWLVICMHTPKKRKSLVFSNKIMFNGDFS